MCHAARASGLDSPDRTASKDKTSGVKTPVRFGTRPAMAKSPGQAGTRESLQLGLQHPGLESPVKASRVEKSTDSILGWQALCRHRGLESTATAERPRTSAAGTSTSAKGVRKVYAAFWLLGQRHP